MLDASQGLGKQYLRASPCRVARYIAAISSSSLCGTFAQLSLRPHPIATPSASYTATRPILQSVSPDLIATRCHCETALSCSSHFRSSIRRVTSLIDSRPPRSSLHAPSIQALPVSFIPLASLCTLTATFAPTVTLPRDLALIAAAPSIATLGRLIASSRHLPPRGKPTTRQRKERPASELSRRTALSYFRRLSEASVAPDEPRGLAGTCGSVWSDSCGGKGPSQRRQILRRTRQRSRVDIVTKQFHHERQLTTPHTNIFSRTAIYGRSQEIWIDICAGR